MEMAVPDLVKSLDTTFADCYARITRTLFNEFIGESGTSVVYRRLADGEETLALLYRGVAEHLRSLSPEHAPAADEFDRLAALEMEHRDTLLEAAEKRRGEKEEGKEA